MEFKSSPLGASLSAKKLDVSLLAGIHDNFPSLFVLRGSTDLDLAEGESITFRKGRVFLRRMWTPLEDYVRRRVLYMTHGANVRMGSSSVSVKWLVEFEVGKADWFQYESLLKLEILKV